MSLKADEQMGEGYFCVPQYNMQYINKASALQLWQLVPNSWYQMPRLNSRAVSVGFDMHEVTQGQIFLLTPTSELWKFSRFSMTDL